MYALGCADTTHEIRPVLVPGFPTYGVPSACRTTLLLRGTSHKISAQMSLQESLPRPLVTDLSLGQQEQCLSTLLVCYYKQCGQRPMSVCYYCD